MSTSAHPNHVVKGNRLPGKGRGASNTNDRGNTDQRRARKAWLVETYRADVDQHDLDAFMTKVEYWWDHDVVGSDRVCLLGTGVPACRCYRCGRLLTIETVTIDKIFTKPEGGTYRSPVQDRREKVTNIRPACTDCNSITGAALASQNRSKKK